MSPPEQAFLFERVSLVLPRCRLRCRRSASGALDRHARLWSRRRSDEFGKATINLTLHELAPSVFRFAGELLPDCIVVDIVLVAVGSPSWTWRAVSRCGVAGNMGPTHLDDSIVG